MGTPLIQGFVSPGFESVAQAFEANFSYAEPMAELGAAVAVYRHGVCVVDLWCGHQDQDRSQPWRRDTLVNVWSTTKALLAVAAARLVDQGLMAYDAPVARYWPEFAAAGKAEVTVDQLLSHQAGLNGFDAPTTYEDCLDWDLVCARLAGQAPAWRPGTDTSYHALTFGWLAGELVRRVSGAATIGDHVRDQVTEPLGCDFHIGLPAALHERVAELIPPPAASSDAAAPAAPDPIAGRAFVNPVIPAQTANNRVWREASIPAGNGQASAQGVARLYAALANDGVLDDVQLLTPRGIAALSAPRSTRPDRALGSRHWAAGVALNATGAYGPNPQAIGHSGWGGSFGCTDPESGIGIGYVMNRMAAPLNDDPRARSLVEAVFRELPVAESAS